MKDIARTEDEVVWQLPTEFVELMKNSPLVSLLAHIHAVALLHQIHHWNSTGPASYSDHLLFQRLYEEGFEGVDSLAERALGSGETRVIVSNVLGDVIREVLSKYATGSADDFVPFSLEAEQAVLAHIKAVTSSMESAGTLSGGISNLLEGLADLHETFVYLLLQRWNYTYQR